MAAFAYNSAMTNEKLPLKEAAKSAVANLFRGFDFRAEMDEAAFRLSGLDHSICGHAVAPNKIPAGFPSFLSVSANRLADGE